MRIRSLVCMSVALLAASSWAARADAPASRAAQKAPAFYMLSPNDPAAEKACKDKGGTVSTDPDGYKICKPRVCAAGGPTTATKLDASDAAAAKKCQDACGTVSTGADGAQVCTKPAG